jgi:iron(III) transport system substrate-binding protein
VNHRALSSFLVVLALSILPWLAPSARGAEGRGDWETEWKKTLEGGKREGRLAVYTFQGDNIEAAIKAFQKKHPEIQVTILAERGAQFGLRIMTERRAEKYLWDICICGPTTPYRVLYPGKALDPIKSALMLPEVLEESRWWGGRHHYVDPEGKYIFVFVGNVDTGGIYYNKTLVNPDEFHSYWDLVHTKWKGKFLALDPRTSGAQRVGVRALYHTPELGPKFIRRLFGEMEITLSRDERQAADWLSAGKFPICILCRRSEVRSAREQGLPVDEFKTVRWKETPKISSGSNGTLAVLNRAPNPHAAKVFINWLLSREGQISFQRIMKTPDSSTESMRIDIPKDPVPTEDRRVEGVKYIMMDTPERGDQKPVDELLKEIIKK